ncbi:hypothetical protein RND71_021858 [Anisodus tanguticus]|uniref:Uncharacterized protein n=1 Tax=Anisodus tanguticus TaxID=243964 RepID=A0AAE1RYL1_9SOLA|nr:hypothetical protein RND71_021858 [Anisodus tanguticus]
MKMLHFKTGPHLLSLNRKVVPQMQHVDFLIPNKMMGRKCVSLGMGCGLGRFSERTRTGRYAVLLGAGDTEVSTSEFDDFSVMRGASGSNELKISVSVSGAKTQEIFDKVFSRMVLDAQPIPGFRRDGLIVSKDLQIEQSFEDLEAIFEPGDPFTFSAIVQRQHPQ